MRRYYFDYAATTPLLPEVKEKMQSIMDNIYGNPSSIHFHGRTAKAEVEEARKICANLLHASLGEIFFTSGATESNHMVLTKCIQDLGVGKIISAPTEHHCITHTLDSLSDKVDIDYLKVDAQGNIDHSELESILKNSEQKCLVTLMHGNNEIGTMHDLPTIGNICKENNAYFNVDAAQTYGKVPIHLDALNIDFLAVSAHKIYGPKGIGLIYINSNNKISPLFTGGAQERNMRAGTENLISIAGFAKATELADKEMQIRDSKIRELRTYLLEKLEPAIPEIQLNGNRDLNYLPNILSLRLPETKKTGMLVFNLDIAGISASAGSACSSGVEQASHVLEAIAKDVPGQSLRVSLSHLHTIEDIDFLVDILIGLCQ